MGLLEKMFGTYSQRELKRITTTAGAVAALADSYKKMRDDELKSVTPKLQQRLASGEALDDILPDAFAACIEASERVLGMRHFPVQVLGGIILHQGRISEIKTGEGKTLVATLPAYLNALSGKGVHIVTVNEYLARRDSEWMGKVYRFLGLSVGLIVHGLEPAERREAYACDITYCTNNELGFDYLRDNMQIYKERRVQRGHNYAVVDEVDSILIDEARTPLIISGPGDQSTDLYSRADSFAKTLRANKVKELDNKEDNDELDGDYIIDEKARTATLTKAGIQKAESYFNIENLTDHENTTLLHHINQAIKARGVMHRDVDYVVKDGEIIIVDEFTGRQMLGRRYNEGLHQAIEAKEGVKVNRESKTLATITFQNYFRMYSKLSGMTGTALTESDEFREIYGLDVVEIDTNMPVVRKDNSDIVYKNQTAKYNAVIDQIIICHEKGQPVLVGTVSIEKSELLSKMLKRREIKHEVLNAKYHEKEAEIISQAGKLGAVTIATNMAGRGTDIMLGGNAEFLSKSELNHKGYSEEAIVDATGYGDTKDEEVLNARRDFAKLMEKYRAEIEPEADKVKEAGGLYIIGTERHESRRIDNQLRGRAGRQGDPGESIFFLSLDDDLMRLFGGDRLTQMMDTMKIDEDIPIQHPWLSSIIEGSQKKIETRNFGIRKNVLQFDDVMNKQREIIYSQRNKVLDGENLKDYVETMMEQVITGAVDLYLPASSEPEDWNFDGLRGHFLGWLTAVDDFVFASNEERYQQDRVVILEMLQNRAKDRYMERERRFTSNLMRELERVILLQQVDTHWMDHIDAMDELKRGIYLRSYAQRDPVVEYRIEGFDMFDDMVHSIQETTVRLLLTAEVRQAGQPIQRKQVLNVDESFAGGDGTVKKQPVRNKTAKVGRNDPCPCGSGKKYKKCCGAE